MVYIELYHGRTDKNQEMDDWGTEGPVFGPFESIHFTYCSHIRMMNKGDTQEDWLFFVEDMVYYDGVYYGDVTVFSELTDELKSRAQVFVDEKAEVKIEDATSSQCCNSEEA